MLCRFYTRLISAALDENRPLGRQVQRHVDRCPSCRAYWREAVALDAGLRAGASDAPRPAVIGRVDGGSRLHPVRWGLAGGLVAAAAALAVGVFVQPRSAPPTPSVSARPRAIPVSNSARPALSHSTGLDPMPLVRTIASQPLDTLEREAIAGLRGQVTGLATDARAVATTFIAYLPAPSEDASRSDGG